MQSPAPTWHDEFRAGVTACLRSWSALRTAVEHGWGGPESMAKAEDLRTFCLQQVFPLPPGNRSNVTMDPRELEDALVIYLEEEFSTVLEDGSERQVVQSLYQLWSECSQGVFATAHRLRHAAEHSTGQWNVVQAPEDDDEDEEMIDREAPALTAAPATVTVTTSAKDYADRYLFGPPPQSRTFTVPTGPVRQLGEAAPMETTTEPMVDDDGFAPVVRKNKRR